MPALVNYARRSRACIETGVAPDAADYRRVRRGWRGRSLARKIVVSQRVESAQSHKDLFAAVTYNAPAPARHTMTFVFSDDRMRYPVRPERNGVQLTPSFPPE
jgi:hypothetical protein